MARLHPREREISATGTSTNTHVNTPCYACREGAVTLVRGRSTATDLERSCLRPSPQRVHCGIVTQLQKRNASGWTCLSLIFSDLDSVVGRVA